MQPPFWRGLGDRQPKQRATPIFKSEKLCSRTRHRKYVSFGGTDCKFFSCLAYHGCWLRCSEHHLKCTFHVHTGEWRRISVPKKNTCHGNEVLPQDTTHHIQRPRYQRGSPCQDPAGNWTTRRLLTIVKRRKLRWYGHVSRSSGLAKTILHGTVNGGKRQGRQRKRWEDNIRE